MKKIIKAVLLASTIAAVSACTYSNSPIDKHGNVNVADLDWPVVAENFDNYKTNVNNSGTADGLWLTQSLADDIRLLQPGMNKDQVHHIMRDVAPTYSAGFKAKEWDYLFNLPNGEGFTGERRNHQHCQLKVAFDSKQNVSGVYTNPQDCLPKKAVETQVIVREVVATPAIIRQ